MGSRAGEIDGGIGIWGVSNPLTDTPEMLVPKIEAGAEVILTQPPLNWTKFDEWIRGVTDAGLHERASIYGGKY